MLVLWRMRERRRTLYSADGCRSGESRSTAPALRCAVLCRKKAFPFHEEVFQERCRLRQAASERARSEAERLAAAGDLAGTSARLKELLRLDPQDYAAREQLAGLRNA